MMLQLTMPCIEVPWLSLQIKPQHRNQPMVRPYDVPYILRTRDYYRAQGYKKDYQWAYHPDAPFTPLPKPLAASTVTVITTAMPDTAPGRAERRVYSMACEPIPNSMYTGGLSWGRGCNPHQGCEFISAAASSRDAGEAGETRCAGGAFSLRTYYLQSAGDHNRRCA